MKNPRPRMIGIDPGSRIVGFAVLEAVKDHPRSPRDWIVLDAGILRTATSLSMSERLSLIHDAVFTLIGDLGPSHAAMEKSFHGINPSSGIKLSEARGSLIAAVGRHSLPLFEFTPAQIKRTIGGSGAATKEQLAHALKSLMGFSRGSLPLDASDAVAIALTGCIHYATLARP